MSRGSRPEPDPRRHPRVPVRVEVIVDPEVSSVAHAINLSQSGLALQSPQPYPAGRRLQLRFRLRAGDPWIELEAEVVWCAPQSDRIPGMSYHEMGLRFLAVGEPELGRLRAFVESGG